MGAPNECSFFEQNNNYIRINRYDRDQRNGQKRKVITFEDSRILRPSTLSQNRPLDDGLYYSSTNNKRDIIINDNGIRDFPTSAQFLQLNSIQNTTIKDNLIDEFLPSDPNKNNSYEGCPNFTSDELLNFNLVQNNDDKVIENRTTSSDELFQFDLEPNIPKKDPHSDADNLTINAVNLLQYKQTQNFTLEDKPAGVHNSVCRLDLLKPLISNNICDKPSSELHSEHADRFPNEHIIPPDGNEAHDKGKNVSWNEMFDTELLPNIVVPDVKDKIIAEHNNKYKNIDTKTSNENLKHARKSKVSKNKAEKETNLKSVKRKKEITLDEEKSLKKLKGNNEKQIRMRKEKYTKTVKKWLDGVDPNNAVEVEKTTESETNPIESITKSKKIDIIVKETLVPKYQHPAKKTIQAQLTNKGGIMKFSKPEIPRQSSDDNPPEESTAAESVSRVTNKVNVKKSKPKFIAPLKSQVPVKEIEFTVVILDESNWNEYLIKFENFSKTELYAVLTYSNGFCQLNKQFTEDDCIPEGIMLLIDEEFYYVKNTTDIFSNIVTKFLEHQTVYCYDGKNILIFFKDNFELEIDIFIYDVKIGGSLLEPDNPAESFSELQKLMSSTPEYTVATECRLQKTAWYLTLLRDCADKLKAKLLEHSMWSLFVDIEMKVLPIIADMESRGVQVNAEKLKSMEGALLSRIKAVELECHRAAGKPFQVTSPVQVAAILYDELQLQAKCNLVVKETLNKGAKSTSETMLRTLVPHHPLPGLILEYRRLHKAHATFLAGIGQHVKNGVIKPIWVQTAAATGRIAANNPNVQAIPKTPFSLSSDATNPAEALNLRSVYVARAGWLLLAADFRQVECRVFARAAADRVLLAALSSAGDLFVALAAKWLNKPEQDVSAADRERTKRIVYARLYGAGVRKLMDILDISYDQALSVQASFDRTFPSLKSFCASVSRSCADGRAPRTPAGRARPLPALLSEDDAARAHAQRQAVNFLVQGTAADICKVAMSSAHARLKAANIRAHLLLQIHDELVWEVASDQLSAAHAIIKSAMESSGPRAGLGCPLPVAARAGRSWGELHIDPDQTADTTLHAAV